MADDSRYSFNNFGGTGLLDMRTARFAPDGTIAVGVHYDDDLTRYFTTWQATPWLETTLSYSDNRLDKTGTDGGVVDRSLDMKIRLWTEGNYRPQLAIGIQDALGTGRFDAEYLVASKRYYDFDFTMGFAWGYLGSRGGIGNMFRLFGDNFDQRSTTTSSGGIRTGSFFSGRDMAFFAGAEYNPPISGLSFKVEYSGVDTTKIPGLFQLKRKTAFNFGVNYKPLPWADVAVGFDHGDRLGIRLTLRQNLHKLKPRKWFRAPEPVPISVRGKTEITEEIVPESPSAKYKTAKPAYDEMTKAGLAPVSISVGRQTVEVRKKTGPFFTEVRNIGRTARILTGEMPDSIEEFVIISEQKGMAISRVSVLRQDLEKTKDYRSSPEEIWVNSKITAPEKQSVNSPSASDIYQPQSGPRFALGVKPDLLTHFGGNDDGRFRADLYAKLYASVQVTRQLTLSAEFKQYIIGDIDEIPPDMRPDVPKVRSDIARYAREGRTAIEQVKLEYTSRIGKDIYARITGGLLESMFGGIGGEILYRPYQHSFAFGLDMNWVKQRDFDQLFSFRDYDVLTGHATFYYENTNYDITGKLSAGRYLAGDYGATFDVSRRFASGIRIGVWATVTDMSSRDFGDGSFDKGIYMTIPLEIFWYRPTREKMRFNFRSLGKNGGQKLNREYNLYDMLSSGRKNRLARDWNGILD
ncbi:MAG: hypothetical protein COB49_06515 [Alphaproteobacteria bacterium]|nr:MAG: hypothetical protein COB49_06515 [Alphaproteobacteria bacterium]